MAESNKRKKKAERRAAKAERKAKQVKEEKKSKPNNLLIALLIVGLLGSAFVTAKVLDYRQKTPTIEKYLADNGGAESFENIPYSEDTVMNITAKKNTMQFDIKVKRY